VCPVRKVQVVLKVISVHRADLVRKVLKVEMDHKDRKVPGVL
jgi:hypothetical protein